MLTPRRPLLGGLRAGATGVLVLALAGLTGCAGPPPTPPAPVADGQHPQDHARALWNGRGPAGYRLVWSANAMVGETRVVAEVRDRRPVGRTVERDDVRWADRAPATVEDLFAAVDGLRAGGTRVDVVSDPDLGYPRSVSVDPMPGGVDDEYRIDVELRPL